MSRVTEKVTKCGSTAGDIGLYFYPGSFISYFEVMELGYEIRYEKGEKKQMHSLWRILGYTFLCFLSFCVLTCRYWPAGREKLLLLFPFLKSGSAALDRMVLDWKEGLPLGDSVSVFLRGVFSNG